MLSLWTGTWHPCKPLATTPSKRRGRQRRPSLWNKATVEMHRASSEWPPRLRQRDHWQAHGRQRRGYRVPVGRSRGGGSPGRSVARRISNDFHFSLCTLHFPSSSATLLSKNPRPAELSEVRCGALDFSSNHDIQNEINVIQPSLPLLRDLLSAPSLLS